MLRSLFLRAANNPKKAASLLGGVLTAFLAGGYTIPDWVVPVLLYISKVCIWLADILARANTLGVQ